MTWSGGLGVRGAGSREGCSGTHIHVKVSMNMSTFEVLARGIP